MSKYIDGSQIVYYDNENGDLTISGKLTAPNFVYDATTGPENFVVGGTNDPSNSIVYSYDGVEWKATFAQLFDSCRTIAYNGYVWLAGGYNIDIYKHNIAISYDGIHWTGVSSDLFILSCNAFAWNGNFWIAGGKNGIPQPDYDTTYTIAISYDGIVWVGISNIFDYECRAVAWNGIMFLAGGNHYINESTPNKTTTAYSYDGFNWQFTNNNLFLYQCTTIAWNGFLWVAGGGNDKDIEESDYTLGYSKDGLNWSLVDEKTFNYCTSIAWNGTLWIAVGYAKEMDNFRSYDGIHWTANSTRIFDVALTVNDMCVCWNKKMWLVSAGQLLNNELPYNEQLQNGIQCIAQSLDGIEWQKPAAAIVTGVNIVASKDVLPNVGITYITNYYAVASTISIGFQAGFTNQGTNSISIGNQAGLSSQGAYAIALGSHAALSSQGAYSIAVGNNAGYKSQGQNALAIGNKAGMSSQGAYSLALGYQAGISSQQEYSIALGNNAGSNDQGAYAMALGNNAGLSDQGTYAVALGNSAGSSNQGTYAIALGNSAGSSNQGTYAMAFGTSAGSSNQGTHAMAFGNSAGSSNQGAHAIALGTQAGLVSQEIYATALGTQAGLSSQGAYAIAFGTQAGKSKQGSYSIAIGTESGLNDQGNDSIAMGTQAGLSSQGAYAMAIGTQAGLSDQKEYSIALGFQAGLSSQGAYALSIGNQAGYGEQGNYATALGNQAGLSNQGAYAISIGNQAGLSSQGAYAISIGNRAGLSSQGAYSISIGNNSGKTQQYPSSIIINASSAPLENSSTSGLFINPVRYDNTNSSIVFYNSTTKELVYGEPIISGNKTYNDDWIQSYLIDPPPSIVFGSITSLSSEIYIPWSYPDQTNVGFINVWLPNISTFTAQISTTFQTNTVFYSTIPIAINKSAGYIDLHNNDSIVTGIILTKDTGVSGIQSRQFPDETSNRTAYVYYDINFGSLIQDKNQITAYYSNCSTRVNKITKDFDIFISSGTPSAPQSIVATNITNQSLTLSYTPPLSNDILDPVSIVRIIDYSISTDSVTNGKRWIGLTPVKDTRSFASNGSNLSSNITNMYPDSLYVFNVKAKNSGNPSYGETSTLSNVQTLNLLPNPIGQLTFASRYFTNGVNIKRISDDLIVTNLVNSQDNWASSALSVPIHTTLNRGSASLDLMYLSTYVVNNGSFTFGPTLQFSGFGNPTPSGYTSNSIQISPSVSDAYADIYKQGFYQNSLNTITLNTPIFNPSQFPYIVNVVGNTGTTTFQFYYDNKPIKPSGTLSFDFQNVENAYVSGVRVVFGTPSFSITATLFNMGNFFYCNPLLSLVNTCGSVVNTRNETNLTNITSGKTNTNFTGLIVIDTTITSTSLSNVFTKIITLTGIANNVDSASNTISATSIVSIVDGPSYNLVYIVYKQNLPGALLSNNVLSVGFRVSSGKKNGTTKPSNPNAPPFLPVPPPITGPTYADTAYDNTANINLLEELQIFNGKICSKGTTLDGYIDYSPYRFNNAVNYSGIQADSNYRFITFAWIINQKTDKAYNTLQFVLTGTPNTITKPNGIALIDGTPIILYYRFENVNNPNPTDGTNISSIWLDGNAFGSDGLPLVNTANYFTPSDNSIARPGLISVTSGIDVLFNVSLPTFIVSNPNTVRLYCRIGLPMNKNFSFSQVNAVISAV